MRDTVVRGARIVDGPAARRRPDDAESGTDMLRAGDLDHFLRALGRAVREAVPPGGPEAALAARIFDALETPGELPPAGPKPSRPAPAEALDAAFALAAQGPEPAQQVAGALRAMDPRLSWGPRPGGEGDDPAFRKAHANAVVTGADGLERRGDVRVGLSLLAPHTDYPRHNHPPEELYFVLAPGDWWREDLGWRARPAGGIQHNPPHARHAMRAGETPLLAVWCLWTADA